MWLLLTVGLIFFGTASTIDPAENCSEDGRECAPWLVPLAGGFGALVALGAGLNMLANPNRGSLLDPATGDLVWWQGRIGTAGGDEGRITPRASAGFASSGRTKATMRCISMTLKAIGCSGSAKR